MERFVVCDFYHEDCSVNIDAVCATFEDAYKAMLKDINDLLEEYSDTEEKAEANVYANSATMIVDGDVVCDWRICHTEVQPTPAEEEDVFQRVRRKHIKLDVTDYLEGTTYVCGENIIDELAALVEKNHDCEVPYNAMLAATVEEYFQDNNA